MLYLGIDQHRNQLTVDLGNEEGELVKHRQVATGPKQLEAFFDWLRELSKSEGGFAAIVEVCGFNDYLLKMLDDYGCREIVLTQPQQRSRRKTDRRDARALRDLLWVNRIALVNGGRLAGLRRVRPCTQQESEQRQVTSLRRHLSKLKTKAVNKVHRILLKHNLQHNCPTKSIDTQRGRQWLIELALPQVDRLVADESQKIKATHSKSSLYFWRLRHHADRRYCLSGTPCPNTALDLFGQMRFLSHDIFRQDDPDKWLEDWAYWRTYNFKRTPRDVLDKRRPELRKLFRANSIRMIADKSKLPEVLHQTIAVELSPRGRRAYEEFRKNLKLQLETERL